MRDQKRQRGQSVVELALLLPVLLLLTMAALDVGRLFMGWVVLNNAARVGANYAALHPGAWGSPGNTAEQSSYSGLVTGTRNDAGAVLAGCEGAAVPAPGFPNGTAIGDYAEVVLNCDFEPMTPLIGDLFSASGNKMNVTARSVFPIRSGAIAGSAVPPPASCLADYDWSPDGADPLTIDFTDLTPATSSGWIWAFGDATGSALQNPSNTYNSAGTYTVELQAVSNGIQCTPHSLPIEVFDAPPTPDPGATPTPAPTATPTAAPCVIPSFIGSKKNNAQGTWNSASFTTTVLLDPNANQNQNWTIEYQSIVGGQPAPCNSTITISPELAP